MMRTLHLSRRPYPTHELASRIGTGAFEYEFGALDGSDNLLANTYSNLLRVSTTQLQQISLLTVFYSHEAFGNPPKELLFFKDVMDWFPSGFLTWFFEKSQSLGQTKLQQNRDEAHRVARVLIDAKREELKAGTSRRDLMSLLGSLLSTRNCTSGAHFVFQSRQVPPCDRNGD